MIEKSILYKNVYNSVLCKQKRCVKNAPEELRFFKESAKVPHAPFHCFYQITYGDYRDFLYAKGNQPENTEKINLSVYLNYSKAIDVKVEDNFKEVEIYIFGYEKRPLIEIVINIDKGVHHSFHSNSFIDGYKIEFPAYYKGNAVQFRYKYFQITKEAMNELETIRNEL